MAAANLRELPTIDLTKLTGKRQLPLLPAPRAFATCKQLRRISQLLQLELDLIDKIRYKQKNQHRSATWWRHVTGARRLATRLQNELSNNLLPLLPDGRDAKSAVYAQTVNRLSETTLRLMALSTVARTAYRKAAAAVQQLLRAALFMPLALTMKAIIARFDSLTSMLEQELSAFMTLIQESASKDATILDRMQKHIARLPQELSCFYMPVTTSSRLSQRRSRRKILLPGAVDAGLSRQTSPEMPVHANAPLQIPRTDVPLARVQMADPVEATASDVNVPSKRPAPDIAEPLQDAAEPGLAADTAKPKKRKKSKPKDDIDAIFAGF